MFMVTFEKVCLGKVGFQIQFPLIFINNIGSVAVNGCATTFTVNLGSFR